MAVRSKRLAGPLLVVAGLPSIVYTCPLGETALVKFVTSASAGLPDCVLFLYIGIQSATNLVYERAVLGASSLADDVWMVLAPGDIVTAFCSGGNVSLALFGAELEGVAD